MQVTHEDWYIFMYKTFPLELIGLMCLCNGLERNIILDLSYRICEHSWEKHVSFNLNILSALANISLGYNNFLSIIKGTPLYVTHIYIIRESNVEHKKSDAIFTISHMNINRILNDHITRSTCSEYKICSISGIRT